MTPQDGSLAPCRCGNPACIIPYGFCHCLCGKETVISWRTTSWKGHEKGKPLFYLKGHHLPSPPLIETGPTFKVDGVYCRLIPLTRGQHAIVWDIHYEWLMRWKWYAHWNSKSKVYYANRTQTINGKRRTVRMHREIIGLSLDDPRKGDHKSGVTLDNRYINLRPADDTQNCTNTKVYSNSASKVKGVTWNKKLQKWMVELWCRGKHFYYGLYSDFEIACAVRKAAEIRHHGEFVRAA